MNEDSMSDVNDLTISLFGTVPDSIVDGPGLRYAVAGFHKGAVHQHVDGIQQISYGQVGGNARGERFPGQAGSVTLWQPTDFNLEKPSNW